VKASSGEIAEGVGSSFDDFMKEYKSSMGVSERALYQVFAREYDLAAQVIGLRKAQRMSQQELAVLANVHQSEISRIERGVANPLKSTLDAIAAALGARIGLFPV
jgi:DNA-binding XRE family transcriptional regulator